MKKKKLMLFALLTVLLGGFLSCIELGGLDDDDGDNGDDGGDGSSIVDGGGSFGDLQIETNQWKKSHSDDINYYGISINEENTLFAVDDNILFASLGNVELSNDLEIPEDIEDYHTQLTVEQGQSYIIQYKPGNGYMYAAIHISKLTATTVEVNFATNYIGENSDEIALNYASNEIGQKIGDQVTVGFDRVIAYEVSNIPLGLSLHCDLKSFTLTREETSYQEEAFSETIYLQSGHRKTSWELILKANAFLYPDRLTDVHAGQEQPYTIPISSNTSWTASCEADWCTLTQDSGNGESDLMYELTTNRTGEPRKTTIWFTSDELDEPVAMHITQKTWFSEGEGTETDPFLIKTVAELLTVNDASGFFLLAEDLDVSECIHDNVWWPIALGAGHFDGGNHTISGLWWNAPDRSQIGFFSVAENAAISNLHLQLASQGITSGDFTGGLVGYTTTRLTLTNCSLTGKITGGDFTGGLVGGAPRQFINLIDCTVNATIQGKNCVGGLAGIACGKIEGCSFDGRIKASGENAGGILGATADMQGYSHNTDMIECATTGIIESASVAGGLIGLCNAFALIVEVENSYSQAHLVVSGTGDKFYLGGLVGLRSGTCFIYTSYFAGEMTCLAGTDATITKAGIICKGRGMDLGDCVFDKDLSGAEYCTGENVEGALSTSAMKTRSTYSDRWDFDKVWSMTAGNYPTLQRIANKQ